MSGQVPVYELQQPVTYSVNPSGYVLGGQLVEGNADGTVHTAAAGSTKVLGVALKDAVGTQAADGTTTYGGAVSYPSSDASFPTPYVSVAHGILKVSYAAAAAFGAKLKAAANGAVTPWVSGTDAADLIVGVCVAPAGVAGASTDLARIF